MNVKIPKFVRKRTRNAKIVWDLMNAFAYASVIIGIMTQRTVCAIKENKAECVRVVTVGPSLLRRSIGTTARPKSLIVTSMMRISGPAEK